MMLAAKNIHKSYESAQGFQVLDGATLEISAGQTVALLGASGSGKSTFLNCLGLLDRFSSGTLELCDENVGKLSERERSAFRLKNIGFVFQFHHLIPELNVLENVILPASLLGRSKASVNDRAQELLQRVGIQDKASRFPWQLSGGEQQRVAVARALINEPRLLFTDEATGNLDRARADEVLDLLIALNRDFGTTLLSVTHDEGLASRYQRRCRLKDGKIWDLL